MGEDQNRWWHPLLALVGLPVLLLCIVRAAASLDDGSELGGASGAVAGGHAMRGAQIGASNVLTAALESTFEEMYSARSYSFASSSLSPSSSSTFRTNELFHGIDFDFCGGGDGGNDEVDSEAAFDASSASSGADRIPTDFLLHPPAGWEHAAIAPPPQMKAVRSGSSEEQQ